MDQEQRQLKEEQKLAEKRLKKAEELEEQAAIAVAKAEKMAREAKSKAEKEAAEKAKKQALLLARREKENRLRHKLDTAIKSCDVTQLEPAIAEVKKEKVPDCFEQLSVAQQLLAQLKAKSNLNSALVARQLQRLEKAMKEVKDGKFEEDLKQEMIQANGLLEKLRRLEDMKSEVSVTIYRREMFKGTANQCTYLYVYTAHALTHVCMHCFYQRAGNIHMIST